MGLTRRLKNRLQAGATYTLMFSMHDDGGIGYTAPGEQPIRLRRRRVRDVGGVPAQHGPYLRAVPVEVGNRDEHHLLLRLGEPLQREHLRHAVRQSGHEPPQPDERRWDSKPDRHPRWRRGSRRRAADDRVGHGDSAQRAARTAAAQSRSADDERSDVGRFAQGDAHRRGVQRLQPRELRQLRDVVEARRTLLRPRSSASRSRPTATPTCRARPSSGSESGSDRTSIVAGHGPEGCGSTLLPRWRRETCRTV